MPEALVAIATLVMILFPRLSVSGASLTLLRRVTVSKSALAVRPWETLAVPSGAPSRLRCSIACSLRERCGLWCLDASGSQCLFSDLIVMPRYAEANAADALECYTRRRKDLATGAGIQATPAAPGFPGRVAGMLVDGIYDVDNLERCYMSEDGGDIWFVLDFGAPVTLRRVEFFLQTRGYFPWIDGFHDVEVRTGMTAVGTLGDFGSYEPFGKFRGPAVAFGQVVVIEVPKPITVRYMSVQETGSSTALQLCHIEVH